MIIFTLWQLYNGSKWHIGHFLVKFGCFLAFFNKTAYISECNMRARALALALARARSHIFGTVNRIELKFLEMFHRDVSSMQNYLLSPIPKKWWIIRLLWGRPNYVKLSKNSQKILKNEKITKNGKKWRIFTLLI